MEVELNAEESSALQHALQSYCSDLRMEIVDTDNPAFKRGLHQERDLLESVLTKLAEARANATSADGPSRIVVEMIILEG